MNSTDLRTQAIVLRRTNYSESDRILNFITPEGKVAALAHGVRKSKSRLAGGIELFSVADIVVHQGRAKLATLTSARMLRFYGNIVSDLNRLEMAAQFLKRIERAAEQISNSEHFLLLDQALQGLNRGLDLSLVETWFSLNLCRVNGDEINFFCDVAGTPLSAEQIYVWDTTESSLRPEPHGKIGVKEIKLARFLLSNPLAWAGKVEDITEVLPPIAEIAKIIK